MIRFLKSREIRSSVPLISLIIVSLWASRALFHPGFYTGHDSWHQVARLYHFDQAVKNGQIPPRYSFLLLHGYGYPLFTFSYHLPWYIAELFVISGVPIFDAIKMVFVIGFVLSGVAMYYWQKELWGVRGGWMASFLYIWAPYRFSNIFVRVSLGEATSFLFLPLLFWGIHKVTHRQDRWGLVIGAIGLSGIILSHSMLLVLIAIPAAVYTICMLFLTKSKIIFGLKVMSIFILGSMLSMYYVLPAIAYQSLTIFSGQKRLLFQSQFLGISDLFYSPWGYAASFTGVGQMSLQLGIGQWLAVFGALAILFKLGWQKKKKSSFWLGVMFLFSFILCLFFTLNLSRPVWKIAGDFLPLDFPWRFLAVLTLISAVLGGLVIHELKGLIQKIVWLLLFLVTLYANRNYLRVNQYTFIPLSLYVQSETTTNTYGEYLPKWARQPEVFEEHRQPLVVPETAKVTGYNQGVNTISFTYESPVPAQVRINTVFFPGMQLFVNNQPYLFNFRDNGYINFSLLAGKSTILLTMKETRLEKIGDTITLAGLLVIGVYIFKIAYPLILAKTPHSNTNRRR